MKHYIERVLIDLILENRDDVNNFQNKISALFKNRLQLLTDKILSEFSDQHTVIYIDKLELDLKNIPAEQFESVTLKTYERALREALSKQLRIKSTIAAALEAPIQQKNTNQSDFEILIFFLEKGRLPSNAAKDLNINQLLIDLIKNKSEFFAQHLFPFLQKKQVFHRIVYTFHEKTIFLLLEQIVPTLLLPIQIAFDNVLTSHKLQQFSTTQQKLYKKLFLIIFELIQQSLNNTRNPIFNLKTLHDLFLNLLPLKTQNTNTPIYEIGFSMTKSTENDFQKIVQLPYSTLKKLMIEANERQKVIENAHTQAFDTILKKLAGRHAKTIKQLIQTEVNLIENKAIFRKMAINSVWSIILEYLAKRKNINNISEKNIQKIIAQQFIFTHQLHRKTLENTQQKPIINQTNPNISELQQLKEIIKNTTERIQKIESIEKNQSNSNSNEFQQLKEIIKNTTERIQKIESIEKNRETDTKNINAPNFNKKTTTSTENLIENKKIETKENIQNIDFQSIKHRSEDILEIFLMQGYFIQQVQNINAIVLFLLETNPSGLRLLLMRIGKNSIVQTRLLQTFPILTLQKILPTISNNLLFFNWLLPFMPNEQQENLYKIAIQQQLQHGTIDANLLLHHCIEKWGDVAMMNNFLRTIAIAPSYEEKNIVQTFLLSHQIIEPDIAPSEVLTNVQANRYLDYFSQYFLLNSNDWWSSNFSPKDINQHFKTVIDTHPKAIIQLLETVGKPSETSQKLVDLLDESNLTRLLNLIEPAFVGFISTILLSLKNWLSEVEAWKISLSVYFKIKNNFTVQIFTEQIILELSKVLQQPYNKVLEEYLSFSEEKTREKQARYYVLKNILQQTIRTGNIPITLPTEITEEKNIDIENNTLESIEIITYYLKHNSLPSEIKHFTLQDIINILKDVGTNNPILLKITLQKLIKNNFITLTTVTQLSKPIFFQLIQTLQPKIGIKILSYYKDLELVIEDNILILSTLKVISSVTVLQNGYLQSIISKIAETLSSTNNFTYSTALTAISDNLSKQSLKTNILKTAQKMVLQLEKNEKENTIEENPEAIVVPFTPLEKKAIYIDNAGVILLWVFMPHLFKMFDLLDGKNFKDLQAAYKAAYLIQYIATGNSTPMEHELILNKIMCSIPLEQPINAIITLTEAEQKACEQMMQAALQRWHKLKNTSPEGLRNSFLKRDGRLTQTSKGWSLSVEQKPYDLLLKSLPWGVALVRFQWMEKPLFIEWV